MKRSQVITAVSLLVVLSIVIYVAVNLHKAGGENTAPESEEVNPDLNDWPGVPFVL